MTTCFCTYVSDHLFHAYGTSKLIKSAKYFYPEIPFYVYGDGEIKEAIERTGLPPESLQPYFIDRAITNNCEVGQVVYFDADSMIVGDIDALIYALDENEVVCVRNNNDYGGSGKDGPLTQYGTKVNEYVNAGLIATHAHMFLLNWLRLTRALADKLPFGSQSVLNALLKTVPGYEYEIIDPFDAKVYYGVSALSGTETHWDSWKQITVENGELMLNGKKVKVLHHAGGALPEKLNFNLFSEQVQKRLIEITT